MNSETHITDYFKREFLYLSRRKQELGEKAKLRNHPFNVKLRTTFNIACEVLGSDVAGMMADERGL